MSDFTEKLHTNYIFNNLDNIENRLNIMAHEIPEIKEELKLWQDKKISSLYFLNHLYKFIDDLNK